MANEKLTRTKENLREVERFCKCRPMPSKIELDDWLVEKELTEYRDYSNRLLEIQQQRAAILHNFKINKSRV